MRQEFGKSYQLIIEQNFLRLLIHILPWSILQCWSKVTVFEEIIQRLFKNLNISPYELLLLSALLSNPPPKMNPLVAMHCDQHTAIYKYKTEALQHMKNEPS